MIRVDSREPEKIGKYFKELKVPVSFSALPIGDMICEEKSICVERKAYADLVSSYKSGHLHQQIHKMAENYDYPYLFISGSYEDAWNFSSKDNCGMISDLLINFPKIRMAFFPNDRQLVHAAHMVFCSKNGGVKAAGKENKEDSFSLRLLCSFEGLGNDVAKQSLRDPVVYLAVGSFLKTVARSSVERLREMAEKEIEKDTY